MNDFDRQNTDFEENEYVQITDLDPASQKRRAGKLLALARKSVATPWIRYSLIGSFLLILLGAFFLQDYRPAPATSPTATSNGTLSGPPANGNGPNVIFGDDQIYIQESSGTLTAYRDEDGRVLWREKLPGQTSLQTAGSVVYAYYATTSADRGILKALNGNNGRVLWQAALPAPGTELALEQFGDTLYAADHNNTLYAFQASNGRVRWTYHDSISPVLPVGNLLQAQDGIASIYNADHSQSLLHASDGRQILRVKPDITGNLPSMTIDGQLIYELPNSVDQPVAQPVQVFRASDGKRLWAWTLQPANFDVSILEQDGVVYRSDSSSFSALQGTDGHTLWTYRTNNDNRIVYSDQEDPGSVYLALQDNTLIRLRASDGRLLWSTQMKVANQSNTLSFFLDSGMLFIDTNDTPGDTSDSNQVYILQTSDGKLLWHASGFSGQPWI